MSVLPNDSKCILFNLNTVTNKILSLFVILLNIWYDIVQIMPTYTNNTNNMVVQHIVLHLFLSFLARLLCG